MNSSLFLQNVKKYLNNELFLENINIVVNKGDKIGILGHNGSGKSTLLKIISGIDKAFEGKRWMRDDISIGYLPQEPKLNPLLNVIDNVKEGLSNIFIPLKEYDYINNKISSIDDQEEITKLFEKQMELQSFIDSKNGWDVDRQIDIVLGALRCPPKDSMVTSLSGGELRRVVLAILLLQKNDILVLDEPTNHLDYFSIEWLVRFLKSYKGALVFVSHQRSFSDSVGLKTIEVGNKNINVYNCAYSGWLERKKIEDANSKMFRDKMVKAVGKELEWMNSSPKARTTKSKSRILNYHTMVEQCYEKKYDVLEIPIPKPPRIGNIVIRTKNLTKRIGDRVLIDNLTMNIPQGAIVGVVGSNGAGKSTLFNIITGNDTDYEGDVEVGETVKLSYITQQRCKMNPKNLVWEEISDNLKEIDLGRESMSARLYASYFNFKGADQQKAIEVLSGGERNRVHLAKSLRQGGNVLLLDEPTNDLDLETIIALEEGLMNFPGVIMIISHDIWFLNKLCTHTCMFFPDGQVEIGEGNYDHVKNGPFKEKFQLLNNQKFVNINNK